MTVPWVCLPVPHVVLPLIPPALRNYNGHMVSDMLSSLGAYSSLSEGLRDIGAYGKVPCPDFNRFEVDRERSTLFIVEEGEALMSTSWREEPDSSDPLAVVRAGQGMFVLYLPGEPYLIRKEGDVRVSMVKVG